MTVPTKPVVAKTRAEALANGTRRYYGRKCKRHPALKGERHRCNCLCVACHKIKKRSRPPTPGRIAYMKWYRTRLAYRKLISDRACLAYRAKVQRRAGPTPININQEYRYDPSLGFAI
jgi:hypothetical protein